MPLIEAGSDTKGRFLVRKEEIFKDRLLLSGSEASHALRSLRVKKGDRILATDGDGNEFLATIEEVRRNCIACSIVGKEKSKRENDMAIWLAQPILRSGRMDFVIEKCTELGVAGFMPYLSPKSSVGARGQPGREKLARWKRISESALKQSLGCVLPEFSDVKEFGQVVDSIRNFEKAFFADEKADVSTVAGLPMTPGEKTKILIIIGPEGGFSDGERRSLADKGAIPFSLGKRRLRSETASILSVGMVACSVQCSGGPR
ncbi:MAG: RsmE family RNA methyltransferase [Candidatus Eisenbacteria bacterium]|nr:RsmE family RNA methyltransferase [Candidatus Eisenbacteria bacterium]